jgi:hypothetical protein
LLPHLTGGRCADGRVILLSQHLQAKHAQHNTLLLALLPSS